MTQYSAEDVLANVPVVSSFQLATGSKLESLGTTLSSDIDDESHDEVNESKGKRKQLLKEDDVLEAENLGVSAEERIQRLLTTGLSGAILDLGHMRMDRCPETLTDLGDLLVELYMPKNYLHNLPDDFGVLGSLRVLDAQSNRLSAVPSSIAMCENLTRLNLSNNIITSIPEEIEDCQKLEQVFLDFNYLQEFPAVCLKLPKLKALYVIENSDVSTLPPFENFERRCTTAGTADLVIQIDNTPALRDQWNGYDARLSKLSNRTATISINWNRIWPDLVEDDIYLGSLRTTQNPSVFSELGITHVLTCGRNLRTNLPEGVKQLVLEVDDNDEEQLDQHFKRAIEFMSSPAASGNGGESAKKVLVHCFAGVSRSATVMIAYHMLKHKVSFTEAFNFVQKKRPAINPNQNFRKQLKQWEGTVL